MAPYQPAIRLREGNDGSKEAENHGKCNNRQEINKEMESQESTLGQSCWQSQDRDVRLHSVCRREAGSSSRQLHFNPQTLIRFHFLVPLLMSSLCLHHQSNTPTSPPPTSKHCTIRYQPFYSPSCLLLSQKLIECPSLDRTGAKHSIDLARSQSSLLPDEIVNHASGIFGSTFPFLFPAYPNSLQAAQINVIKLQTHDL